MNDPFAGPDAITISIRELIRWFEDDGKHRLRLPAIQRSAVWRNAQIINLWDSLLRGYPVGMMMVVRARPHDQGRGIDGTTDARATGEYHLFDGQQRLLAILLGVGKGVLRHTLRLWVDPINEAKDLTLGLRISSSGNPFGYLADAPNAKPPVPERREMMQMWKDRHGVVPRPGVIFDGTRAKADTTFVEGVEVVSLPSMLGFETPPDSIKLTEDKRRLLDNVLDQKVIVYLCPQEVLLGDNYKRYFERLGQGGTRLSNDELVYSLIKLEYPKVHDEIEKISHVGSLAAPVDLVLAAFRVAKAKSRPGGSSGTAALDAKWFSRPNPDLMKDDPQRTAVFEQFQTMLDNGNKSPTLSSMFEDLDKGLRYGSMNPGGLPNILMADLPSELVDVLILVVHRRHGLPGWDPQEHKAIAAFALHWVIFCTDHSKAALEVYRRLLSGDTGDAAMRPSRFDNTTASTLISAIEAVGAAYVAPRPDDLSLAEETVDAYDGVLRDWNTRLAALSSGQNEPECRLTLRSITTDRRRLRRLLAWVQRHYLAAAFPGYDPTSVHDEDMPFDLDHLLPSSLFGAHESTFERHLEDRTAPEHGPLLKGRRVMGNSLGNFRLLAFHDNRARGNNAITEVVAHHPGAEGIDRQRTDAQENEDAFNYLIEVYKNKAWTPEHTKIFQQTVDRRALALYKTFLTDSGLDVLLGAVPAPSH